MKKRYFCLLLAMVLCVCMMPSALAAGVEIAVKPSVETVKTGDTFTVSAEISGNSGFSAVQFTLVFDKTKVECVSATTGPLLQGMLAATNPNAKGGAIVAAASASEVTGDGVLATFTFRALSDAGSTFRLADVILSSSDRSDVAVSLVGGTVGAGGSSQGPAEPEKPATQPETNPAGGNKQSFSDTDGHWAERYISTAVDRGYFKGYPDGSFKPGGRVTRGAFVTVLWRMAGKPEPDAAAPFTDTASLSAEFQKAIAWAYGKGYINGRTATTFAPGEPVSRQAAMKILYLYNGGVSGPETMFTGAYDSAYTDSGAMASWAKAPMYWAVYNELISGTSATTIGATGLANRAQLAKILVNYADKLGG